MHLVSIAQAFQATNAVIRQEATRAKEMHGVDGRIQSTRYDNTPQRYPFSERDLEILDDLIQAPITGASTEGLSGLLEYLQGISCLSPWRAGLESLILYQSNAAGSTDRRMSKQLALDILTQRDVAAENFEQLQFTQRTLEVKDFCARIQEKILLMQRFVAVYNTQPVPETGGHQSASEPQYDLYPLSSRSRYDNKPRRVAEAYPRGLEQKLGKRRTPRKNSSLLGISLEVSSTREKRLTVSPPPLLFYTDTEKWPCSHHRSHPDHAGLRLPTARRLADVAECPRLQHRRGILSPHPQHGHVRPRDIHRHIPFSLAAFVWLQWLGQAPLRVRCPSSCFGRSHVLLSLQYDVERLSFFARTGCPERCDLASGVGRGRMKNDESAGWLLGLLCVCFFSAFELQITYIYI